MAFFIILSEFSTLQDKFPDCTITIKLNLRIFFSKKALLPRNAFAKSLCFPNVGCKKTNQFKRDGMTESFSDLRQIANIKGISANSITPQPPPS